MGFKLDKNVRMKLTIFILVILTLSLIVYYIQNSNSKIICINEKCFDVKIADSNAEREQGLMYKSYLEENKGMLFVFEEEGIYSFWMKNTLISLDMIWIDKDNKIVFIKENAEPLNETDIVPSAKALYVLEINAGMINKYEIKVGDNVEIK